METPLRSPKVSVDPAKMAFVRVGTYTFWEWASMMGRIDRWCLAMGLRVCRSSPAIQTATNRPAVDSFRRFRNNHAQSMN